MKLIGCRSTYQLQAAAACDLESNICFFWGGYKKKATRPTPTSRTLILTSLSIVLHVLKQCLVQTVSSGLVI